MIEQLSAYARWLEVLKVGDEVSVYSGGEPIAPEAVERIEDGVIWCGFGGFCQTTGLYIDAHSQDKICAIGPPALDKDALAVQVYELIVEHGTADLSYSKLKRINEILNEVNDG